MSYMNDGCDPFGIPYIEYENKKTVKKERDKPIERFTYNGCIIYDNINNERMEIWETAKSLNQLTEENEKLNEKNQKLNNELCILQMDLCKTKSYEQLEKENKRLKKQFNRIRVENQQLRTKLYEKELKK